MRRNYPNYEKCHTMLINGNICECLMNEYNLCPQKIKLSGIGLCVHPDNYKFEMASNLRERQNKQ